MPFQFRYAGPYDVFLIFTGSLFSFLHGAGWPLLSIVLGGMTDTFLRAQNSDFVKGATYSTNSSALQFNDSNATVDPNDAGFTKNQQVSWQIVERQLCSHKAWDSNPSRYHNSLSERNSRATWSCTAFTTR